MGRRIKKIAGSETTTYLYDGWNMIRETIDDGVSQSANHYVWGLDLSGTLQGAGGVGGLLLAIHDGDAYYPGFDANGNVTGYTDPAGVTTARYEFDPFGNTTSQTGNMAAHFVYRFSTKYTDDETGLLYYGYRYLNPELGRWINQDPIGEQGGLNVYGFVGNAATGGIDPLGLDVFVAYRAFDMRLVDRFFRLIGHVYLAFNQDNMGAQWRRVLEELGYTGYVAQGWLTFSFHPDSVRSNSGEHNKVGVLYTRSSWVGSSYHNEEASMADVDPIERGVAKLTQLTTDECEQIELFRAAHKSYLANLGPRNHDRGYYSLTHNNCGRWAKSIVNETSVEWPASLEFTLNLGTGVGGPGAPLGRGAYVLVKTAYTAGETVSVAVPKAAGVVADGAEGTVYHAGKAFQWMTRSAEQSVNWVVNHWEFDTRPTVGSHEGDMLIRGGVNIPF